jgi:enoyl-CoA hydratase
MSTSIITSREGSHVVITLAAPPGKPPVLDHDVLASFEETLEAIDRDIREMREDAPRCVVLQSDSPKFFCVGANLNVLKTLTADNFGDWLELGHRVFALLENLPVPVVAKVGGYALGGGLELAMAADVIVAGESARLGLTEARLGFVPGWGGIFRLAERVGRSRAKQMFFSSEMVDARAAAAIGLVDRVVTDDSLDRAVGEFTDEIVSNNAGAVAAFKRILDDERNGARKRVDAAEIAASMDCIRDPDTKDRIKSFLNRPKSRT